MMSLGNRPIISETENGLSKSVRALKKLPFIKVILLLKSDKLREKQIRTYAKLAFFKSDKIIKSEGHRRRAIS